MGISQFMAKEIMKELSNKSREFYEFILPPVDIVEGANDLVVTIDLPGFAKKDIKLRIVGNVLSISGKREDVENEVLSITNTDLFKYTKKYHCLFPLVMMNK